MYAWVQGKLRRMHRKVELFRKFIFTDEDDLEAIVAELDGITDVELLGRNLGIRLSALDEIIAKFSTLEQLKTEVIDHWLKRSDARRQKQDEHPTLDELMDAVSKLNPSSSRRIRHKFRYRLNPTLGERIYMYCKQC